MKQSKTQVEEPHLRGSWIPMKVFFKHIVQMYFQFPSGTLRNHHDDICNVSITRAGFPKLSWRRILQLLLGQENLLNGCHLGAEGWISLIYHYRIGRIWELLPKGCGESGQMIGWRTGRSWCRRRKESGKLQSSRIGSLLLSFRVGSSSCCSSVWSWRRDVLVLCRGAVGVVKDIQKLLMQCHRCCNGRSRERTRMKLLLIGH
mmetsp:Transcript_3858/g.8207  ORF Transcript_3858/g.8207 Transcript_3858/m.8207 type:complete len:203 (+) Transcript_3858:307-915(+)